MLTFFLHFLVSLSKLGEFLFILFYKEIFVINSISQVRREVLVLLNFVFSKRVHYTLFFYTRILFSRSRLNILIFLPMLGDNRLASNLFIPCVCQNENWWRQDLVECESVWTVWECIDLHFRKVGCRAMRQCGLDTLILCQA